MWSGHDARHEPTAFQPSRHRVGEHGDLYRCRACGTVHQPSLPQGEDLHALYREMADETYLAEEPGRRRTARRLVSLLGRHVSSGRLLDVGCGYGLLLDEARRLGYEVEGIELSRAGARHARERLGLPVREISLDDPALDGERYDAIAMVDVLEHLDDPVAAIERLASLLAPGGVLAIVTPDPSSRVARLAGRRWWGYLPAHYCLIPRKTLRGLLQARGLAVVEEVPYAHSFTLGYWLAGLGDRGGRASQTIAAVAALLPRSLTLTASLRDEHVLLARKSTGAAHERQQPS